MFHLATEQSWADALAAGAVEPRSLTTEGFVHCSTAEQLPATIERHFPGVEALVLLRLDADVLGDALVWEEGRPGEVFPHLYRPIAADEVIEVLHWRRGEMDFPS